MAKTINKPIESTYKKVRQPSAAGESPVCTTKTGRGDGGQQQAPADRVAKGAGLRVGLHRHASNIQVHDFQRIVFDEFAPRLDVFTHERSKNVFRRDRVLELYLQQGPCVRVHGRIPQLLGVHFA
jgi:hypothetical protein